MMRGHAHQGATPMIDPARHRPLLALAWDPAAARLAIDDIVRDALDDFDPEGFWPAHPQDDIQDGHTSFYCGATGMVWGLDYLRRVGATAAPIDFRPVLPHLMAANAREFAEMNYAAHGSFLFGDLGTALVAMRLAPSADIADKIHRRARANDDLPARELMWGLAGSMLAALHMHDMTGEPRWRRLFEDQATRLLDGLEDDAGHGRLWTQDLYGSHRQWLGPVHGFAGNMIPLLRGWAFLTEAQRATIAEAVPRTLAANAWRSDDGTSWLPHTEPTRFPWLCQHCHGAPGMVTTFAAAPFRSAELDALILSGGAYTFASGPLTKGSNLCHGTGGNGYAFLKLFAHTGDPLWLDRARAFAMTAIAQYRESREAVGRGRYSLWTGDVGLAVYLWDCLRGVGEFPTVEVF
jgi:Lanthionine synthetase C-like protein